MDFDSIVRSSYSWISTDKILWFVAFFWIALPFIIILPQIFAQGSVYTPQTAPLAVFLYDILYIALILGVILLIQHSLAHKNERVVRLGAGKVVDLFFLVFVELFYVFVWNINIRLRKIQILLIISSALLWYLFFLSFDVPILVLFALSLLGYFFIAIRNFVMVFFSTSIFCNRPSESIRGAIFDSWSMTHKRVADTFSSIIVSAFLAFILFAFVTLVLGAVSSIILRFFFIDSLAISFGFKVAMAFGIGVGLIAYHFMIAEVYAQLDRHRSASSSIKRILSRRVLSPKGHKSVGVRRSFAKKKVVKKKSRR